MKSAQDRAVCTALKNESRGDAMTLAQLHYVLAIAAAGSMNRAAEQLYVSQPTLTSAVRELESEIGFPVFARTNRGVVTTPSGADFLEYARQVCQQYELLESRFIRKRPPRRKFGVSTQHYSFVDKAFVEMVRHFGTERFEFSIRETRTLDVIRDVGENRSEIGILFRSRHNRRVLSNLLAERGLEFRPLIECSANVYLWKGHPLAGRESIGFEELAPYPGLFFEQGSESSSYFAEEILIEREYPRVIRATDRASMLNLMVGLNGYTLCSGIICEELNGTDYVAVPFREDRHNQNTVMEIGYIRRRGAPLSEIAEIFLGEIRRYLGLQETPAIIDPA